MTTLAQLKKIAKDDLTPFMKSQGFSLVNTFGYLKEGPEDIYYLIYPDISYGENLKVTAACHTAEMQQLIGTKFPKFVSRLVAGELEPGEPIAYENGYIWKVETEEQAKQAVSEIKSCIIDSALPFFESMTSRQKLFDFTYPSMRKGKYAEVLEEVLAWKPTNEE